MTQNILLTGASAGFGKAIVELLAPLVDHNQQHLFRIYGVARREDKLQQLAHLYPNFVAIKLDLIDINQVDLTINKLLDNTQIDILINNAGLALGLSSFEQQLWGDILTMIQTNIIASSQITHLILQQFKQRNQGYIINLSSIAANYAYSGGNVYGATKAYLAQLGKNLRADLLGTNIRVTNLEPGLCGDTEFSNVRFKGDQAKVDATYNNVDYIKPQDIARIIKFLLEQPTYININSIEVMPVAQAPAGLAIARKA